MMASILLLLSFFLGSVQAQTIETMPAPRVSLAAGMFVVPNFSVDLARDSSFATVAALIVAHSFEYNWGYNVVGYNLTARRFICSQGYFLTEKKDLDLYLFFSTDSKFQTPALDLNLELQVTPNAWLFAYYGTGLRDPFQAHNVGGGVIMAFLKKYN
ncbi:hypothetical protein H6771_02790 [Candidatus Peribacteria bacterium]|nr:hypothetical protein [Candidatus Peribacteria bacterium]